MPKLSESSQAPETIWLEIGDFELICFNLAVEEFSIVEPIPDYSTRNQAKLEASLASPKQTFDGKLLYPTLEKQAAILFYSLIKNHPFENGNKRISVMALLTFLALNEKWLIIHPDNLSRLALSVSESKPKDRARILKNMEARLKKRIEEAE